MEFLTPAQRLQKLPPYVFARLDELKAQAREQGIDLIDLGMGNPDGPVPKAVVDAGIAAMADPINHRYPPFEGTPSFRKTISEWYERRYQVDLDPDKEALPLLGSKEGLTHLALAYIDPGDVVLVPSPAYPAHFRGPLIAGGEIYPLPMTEANNWLFDLDAVPTETAEKAKVLYFNYPNNPTAATAPREFFEKVVDFGLRHHILLVHDLCYAELAFDGYKPVSMLQIPGAREIGVEFHTLSKTYSMAGWRVGFVVGNREIIQNLRTLKTNLDYGLFAAIQKAAETALQLPDTEIVAVQDRYRSRRDFMLKGFKELGWPVERWVTRATMYLWLPVPAGQTSTDFALSLLEKTGVVVTPGSAFGEGGEGYMRVSLICNEDRMTEALNRMKEAGIHFE